MRTRLVTASKDCPFFWFGISTFWPPFRSLVFFASRFLHIDLDFFHMNFPLRLVPTLVVLSTLAVGCGGSLIPNTDVPDSGDNRRVVEFVEEYRHAMEARNVAGILRLVSENYLDDNGTPDSNDDIDFEKLRDELVRWEREVLEVRYEIRYRRVSYRGDNAFVDLTYSGSFKIRSGDQEHWSRRLSDNRIELWRQPNGEYRIVGGL